MNLPNQLTVARLGMAGVFVMLMSSRNLICYAVAYLVFIAASLTDYYDGKIARARNQITNLGKLLDPVADKVLLTAAFVMLASLPNLWIPPWAIVLILAREFLVTGARSLAASGGVVIAANQWGKAKAIVQMVYVFTFLFFAIAGDAQTRLLENGIPHFNTVLRFASFGALLPVLLVTTYSGIQFARVNWRLLRAKDAL